MLLLDILGVWNCTFTVATCIDSVAFYINVFEYFLQPVAIKSQHIQVEGNNSLEIQFLELYRGCLYSKKRKRQQRTHILP